MVTVDKIQRGVGRYIEEQILGKVSGLDAWMIPGFATLYLANLPKIIKDAAESPLIKYSGVVGSDGTIDVDKIVMSFKPGARKSPAKMYLPITKSEITLTEQDLDMIANYIRNA